MSETPSPPAGPAPEGPDLSNEVMLEWEGEPQAPPSEPEEYLAEEPELPRATYKDIPVFIVDQYGDEGHELTRIRAQDGSFEYTVPTNEVRVGETRPEQTQEAPLVTNASEHQPAVEDLSFVPEGYDIPEEALERYKNLINNEELTPVEDPKGIIRPGLLILRASDPSHRSLIAALQRSERTGKNLVRIHLEGEPALRTYDLEELRKRVESGELKLSSGSEAQITMGPAAEPEPESEVRPEHWEAAGTVERVIEEGSDQLEERLNELLDNLEEVQARRKDQSLINDKLEAIVRGVNELVQKLKERRSYREAEQEHTSEFQLGQKVTVWSDESLTFEENWQVSENPDEVGYVGDDGRRYVNVYSSEGGSPGFKAVAEDELSLWQWDDPVARAAREVPPEELRDPEIRRKRLWKKLQEARKERREPTKLEYRLKSEGWFHRNWEDQKEKIYDPRGKYGKPAVLAIGTLVLSVAPALVPGIVYHGGYQLEDLRKRRYNKKVMKGLRREREAAEQKLKDEAKRRAAETSEPEHIKNLRTYGGIKKETEEGGKKETMNPENVIQVGDVVIKRGSGGQQFRVAALPKMQTNKGEATYVNVEPIAGGDPETLEYSRFFREFHYPEYKVGDTVKKRSNGQQFRIAKRRLEQTDKGEKLLVDIEPVGGGATQTLEYPQFIRSFHPA